MTWTKTKPIAPLKYPSDWYWYYEKGEKEPWVVQIWPGRTLQAYSGLWWDEKVSRVKDKPELPKIEEVKTDEEVEENKDSPPKKRRGRPKGSKNKPKE